MQKHDARRFVCPVIMNRDDVDARRAQRFQPALQILFMIGEIAIDAAIRIAAGECCPGVDAMSLPISWP